MSETNQPREAAKQAREDLKKLRRTEKEAGPAVAAQAAIAFLKNNPDSDRGFVMLARFLIKQKRFADARRAAEKARTLAPLETDPLITLGVIAMRQKAYSDAALAFAEAISLDPQSPRAHLGAAEVKMIDENYDDAIAICEKVLEFDPELERAHELMARINVKNGNTEKGLEDLRQFIMANPGSASVIRTYAGLMHLEGRLDEALEVLERNVEQNPKEKNVLAALTRVAIKAGKPERALERHKVRAHRKQARPSDKISYISSLIQAAYLEEAEAEIESLGDRAIYKPIAAKLRGDVATARNAPAQAIKFYKTVCRMSGVDMPDVMQTQSAEEQAMIWRKHSRRALAGLLRERQSTKLA